MLDKMVKDHRSDAIGENTYIDELDKDTYEYIKKDLSEDEIKELDDYFGLAENLKENIDDTKFNLKLETEFKKRLEEYAPKFGFANGAELEAAMEDDWDLYNEVIEFDDGDNFLDLYLNWWPDEKMFEAEDEYYHRPLRDVLADCLSESLNEDAHYVTSYKGYHIYKDDKGDKPYWCQRGYTDQCWDAFFGSVSELKDYIDKYSNDYGENLEEAKKDEEELPPDPGAVKVEVHGMLNNLVADEIEAIDGYEEAKADIIEQPIEHKDEIIATLDHIKDEEKEHIDELIDAASEIPFDKEHEEAPVIEEPVVVEEPVEEPLPEEPVEEELTEDAEEDLITCG